ncbi:hypothetical protein C172_12001 [Paenibacillus sp. FSL H8-457]|nr:hypothetical protein C172_12001 [Paenibacillus sp. FSL H8-457]
MTRDSDVYPTRTERVQLANTLNADVFVSIHGNSVLESPQANGTETYQRSSSKQLANATHKRLIKAMGLKDRGVKDKIKVSKSLEKRKWLRSYWKLDS